MSLNKAENDNYIVFLVMWEVILLHELRRSSVIMEMSSKIIMKQVQPSSHNIGSLIPKNMILSHLLFFLFHFMICNIIEFNLGPWCCNVEDFCRLPVM